VRSLSSFAAKSTRSQAELKGRSNWPLLTALETGARRALHAQRVAVPARLLALDPPRLAFEGVRGAAPRRMGDAPGFDPYNMQTSSSLTAPRVASFLRPAGDGGTVAADSPFHISLSEDLKLNWVVRSQPGGNARPELGVRVGLQYKF